MSTALVSSRPQNALVTFEGVDASVMPISAEFIELIQPTSRAEGGIQGKFRNKETGQHVDEFLAVPISLYTNRVLFPPTPPGAALQLGQQPLCRSNDGVRPAENVIDKKSKDCASCSFSQWKKVGGKSIKPACQLKLIFTFVELDSFKVFKYTASGTSIAPLQSALKNIRNEVGSAQKKALLAKRLAEAAGTEFTADTLNLGLDSFVIRMKPAKVVASSGVYYTVNFTPNLAPHESPEIFREIYQSVLKGLELAYQNKPVTDEDGQEYVDSEAQAFVQDLSGDKGTPAAEPIIEA